MGIETPNTNNQDQLLNKIIPLDTHVVTDGGALLRQVFWFGATFKEVINKDRRYASSNNMILQIVFYEYK